tara:strand:+ start:2378 stop:2527 length:150 start_codon:yes stop_codon:yes gene_type:complete
MRKKETQLDRLKRLAKAENERFWEVCYPNSRKPTNICKVLKKKKKKHGK